jgi:hypothetical protein
MRRLRRLKLTISAICALLMAAAAVFAVMQAPRPNPFEPHKSLLTLQGAWDGLRYPIERNAIDRLPAISEPLISIHFHEDGQRGWGVGGGGTILATRDGGTTWQAQSSGTQAHLWSVQFLPDGQRGWAVGVGGTILSTRDGGTTWTRNPAPYQRWPAPWLYLSWLVVTGLWLLVFRALAPDRPIDRGTIAPDLESD